MEELMVVQIRRVLVACFLLCSVFVLSCDEGAIRTLGAKVGLRGQDTGTAAVKAIRDISAYQDTDFNQRLMLAVLVQPPAMAATPPRVKRNTLDATQVASRLALYA